MLLDGKSHGIQVGMNIKIMDSGSNVQKEIVYESQMHNNSSIDILIHNEDGTLDECFEIPFHSFTQRFAYFLYFGMWRTSTAWTSATGTSINSTNNVYDSKFNFNAGASTSLYGILVGTGSLAETSSLLRMAGLVIHGTTNGTLNHQATTFTAPAEISGSYGFSVQRQFINQGATSIDVREIGLQSWCMDNTANAYALIARDRYDKDGNDINITVGAGQTLTVRQNLYIDNTDGMTKFLLDDIYGEAAQAAAPAYTWTQDAASGAPITSFSPSTSNGGSILHCNGSAGIYRVGVQAGTGTTTTSSLYTNRLDIPITEGTGEGQLTYAINTTDGFVDGNTQYSFNFRRVLTNNTTSDITIREVGLFCCGEQALTNVPTQTNASYSGICLLRKLTGDITIVPTAATEIILTLTFPAS